MTTEQATREQIHAHDDAILEGACNTCDGDLRARITQRQVWAWCGTCHRLTRPVMVPGPGGAILMHPAAMA